MTVIFHSETVVVGHPDIPSVYLDGEAVLFHAAKRKYVGLDDIGSDIWRRLHAPVPVGELCAGMAADYDATAETIMQDVTVFLEKLASAELIDILP